MSEDDDSVQHVAHHGVASGIRPEAEELTLAMRGAHHHKVWYRAEQEEGSQYPFQCLQWIAADSDMASSGNAAAHDQPDGDDL